MRRFLFTLSLLVTLGFGAATSAAAQDNGQEFPLHIVAHLTADSTFTGGVQFWNGQQAAGATSSVASQTTPEPIVEPTLAPTATTTAGTQSVVPATGPIKPLWAHQFGTEGNDDSGGIAVVGSSIYVSGTVIGSLDGNTSFGKADAFVRKYDADGREIWTRQFGTGDGDFAAALAADASGVYVAGTTLGDMTGHSGAYGAYVRKYDSNGNELWTQQFKGGSTSQADAVAVNASGVYVAGFISDELPGQTKVGGLWDAYVRKYDLNGNELWTRQFGSEGDDEVISLAADTTGVYLAGRSNGALPGEHNSGGDDAYVRKYDPNDNELWTHQFGSASDDHAMAVAVDSSGVYVGGWTKGALPGQSQVGGQDAFIFKYDPNGKELWAHQFGTESGDHVSAITVGPDGIFVGGGTEGILPGQKNSGSEDGFISQYDSSGNERWTYQFGTRGAESVYGIAANSSGVYAIGSTSGSFSGHTNAGMDDIFVVKLAH